MNFNRKRHKVLQLLAVSRIQFESRDMGQDFKFGISFSDLEKELRCNKATGELIYSELYAQNEIEHTDTAVYGLIATQNGLASFSNRKYLRKNNLELLDIFRNVVQIFIPVLSLIIAILAIVIKVDTLDRKTNIEVNKLRTEVQELRQEINSTKNKSR